MVFFQRDFWVSKFPSLKLTVRPCKQAGPQKETSLSGRVVLGWYSSYWMMINPYIPSLKYSLRGIKKKTVGNHWTSRVPSGKLIIAMENPYLFLVNTISKRCFFHGELLVYRSVFAIINKMDDPPMKPKVAIS